MAYSEVRVVVAGGGPFPIDMLRHDSCCPDSESDSELIQRSMNEYGHWKIVIRKLVKKVAKANWRSYWCSARWASFNCYLASADCHTAPRPFFKTLKELREESIQLTIN